MSEQATDKVGGIAYPLGYYAGLDGLRGAMTLGVMAAHLRYEWYPGSIVFMDTFFIMSAYLITSMLLKDWFRDGRIGFRRFYLRRMLRLFPANYLMLAVFALICFGVLAKSPEPVAGFVSTGLYVSNWARAFELGYPTYLGHTWSLAIEEQFYVLWPLVLAVLLRVMGVGWRAALWVFALAIAAAIWRSYLTLEGASIWRLYNGFDTRVDALLMGTALALLFATGGVREHPLLLRWLPKVGLLVAVVFAFWAGPTLEWTDRRMYLYGNLLCSLASVLMVAALVVPASGWLRSIFSIAPLVWCGRICYGLYLWHFPIFNLLRENLGLGIVGVSIWGVLLTFVAASISYYGVERPVLRWRNHLTTAKA